jgi:hypothetical protein
MDRNLWATAVYSWTEGSIVRWNYYQWWNNKARSNAGTISWTNSATSWITDAWSYSNVWHPWYAWATMIVDTTNYDWADPQNDNLWWGASWTAAQRKWPCPSWYHVPSTEEWLWLVKAWFTLKWVSCTAIAWLSCSWSWNATLASFKSDLNLPLAGLRTRSSTSAGNQGSDGYYWSSSPIGTCARLLNFFSSYVAPQYCYNRTYGFSVRCFKN